MLIVESSNSRAFLVWQYWYVGVTKCEIGWFVVDAKALWAASDLLDGTKTTATYISRYHKSTETVASYLDLYNVHSRVCSAGSLLQVMCTMYVYVVEHVHYQHVTWLDAERVWVWGYWNCMLFWDVHFSKCWQQGSIHFVNYNKPVYSTHFLEMISAVNSCLPNSFNSSIIVWVGHHTHYLGLVIENVVWEVWCFVNLWRVVM